jgi:hypothetical protein
VCVFFYRCFFARLEYYIIQFFIMQAANSFLTIYLQLKPLILTKTPSGGTAAAACQLGCRQLYKHGILSDALDPTPWNAIPLPFPKTKKSTLLWDQQRGHAPVVRADLQILGVPQPSAVT